MVCILKYLLLGPCRIKSLILVFTSSTLKLSPKAIMVYSTSSLALDFVKNLTFFACHQVIFVIGNPSNKGKDKSGKKSAPKLFVNRLLTRRTLVVDCLADRRSTSCYLRMLLWKDSSPLPERQSQRPQGRPRALAIDSLEGNKLISETEA